MRTFIQITLLFLFCSLYSTAQDRQEIVTYNVKLNTLTILDKDVYTNCGALFTSLHDFDGYKLTILQLDTSSQWMKCMCYFDLSYSFRSLDPGEYDVEIYRERLSYPGNPMDTILVIRFSFEAKLGPMPPLGYEFKQSECSGITEIEDDKDEREDFKIAPNPASDKIILACGCLASEIFDIKTIGIYDVFGKSVKDDIKFTTSPNLTHNGKIELDISKLPSGIYFIRAGLGNNGKVKQFVKY